MPVPVLSVIRASNYLIACVVESKLTPERALDLVDRFFNLYQAAIGAAYRDGQDDFVKLLHREKPVRFHDGTFRP